MAQDLPYELSALEQSLSQQLAASEQQRAQLVTVLDQWAETTGRELLRILDRWCDWAENPRDPRQAAARKLIDAYVATHRRAEAISTGVLVASKLPPAGKGSG